MVLGIQKIINKITLKINSWGNIWEPVPNVPKWVEKQAELISRKYGGTSSWAVDRVWHLKGSTYRYRLFFEEQGGTRLYIERKKRWKALRRNNED